MAGCLIAYMFTEIIYNVTMHTYTIVKTSLIPSLKIYTTFNR